MRDIERFGPYGIKRRVLDVQTDLSDFIGKRHKRVVEYTGGWPEEESPRLAVVDTERAICGGEVEEIVVSYLFVRYFCSPYKRVDFIRLWLMRSPCCISLPGLGS